MYAYADSSDTDCPFSRRSTGGFVIFVNRSAVSWLSALQRLVTLSSCESDCMQACIAAQEIVYLWDLMQLLGSPQARTLLYLNNVAAIQLSDNPMYRGLSKHIARQWCFMKQCVR